MWSLDCVILLQSSYRISYCVLGHFGLVRRSREVGAGTTGLVRRRWYQWLALLTGRWGRRTGAGVQAHWHRCGVLGCGVATPDDILAIETSYSDVVFTYAKIQ